MRDLLGVEGVEAILERETRETEPESLEDRENMREKHHLGRDL